MIRSWTIFTRCAWTQHTPFLYNQTELAACSRAMSSWVLMTTTLAFALVPFPDGGLHKCAGAPFVHWRPSLLPHPSNRIILGRLGCSVRVSKTTSVMQQTSHKFLVTANLTRSVFSAMSSWLS